MKLSIIICTYNRIELLKKVLDTLTKQIVSKPFELLVINNNSTDNTESVVLELVKENNQVKYFNEANQGLSFARNHGVRQSIGEWVLFIDDDALPEDDLFDKLNPYLTQTNHLIVGGHYSAWYYYGKKKWSKDKYYSNYPTITKKTFCNGNNFLSGGILLIHKSIFLKVGYFDTELGMIGNKIGYSEETEFQLRLRKTEVQLLYDPEIKVRHVVAKQKLHLKWFFISKKSLADALYKTTYKGKYHFALILPPLIVSQLFIYCIKNLFLLFFQKRYYIQNLIIDTFSKPYKWYWIWNCIIKN
jgi:glycosyltransferase involved in cell wall biosynthesis